MNTGTFVQGYCIPIPLCIILYMIKLIYDIYSPSYLQCPCTIAFLFQENASSSLQGFLTQLIETVADIGEGVQPVATAAKVQVDKMGKQVYSCCLVT